MQKGHFCIKHINYFFKNTQGNFPHKEDILIMFIPQKTSKDTYLEEYKYFYIKLINFPPIKYIQCIYFLQIRRFRKVFRIIRIFKFIHQQKNLKGIFPNILDCTESIQKHKKNMQINFYFLYIPNTRFSTQNTRIYYLKSSYNTH